jgi:hypothetical protein
VPHRYRNIGYTYDSVAGSADFLAAAGWIDNWIATSGRPSGTQSTMVARPKFVELVGGITGDDIVPRPDREPIWLKDSTGALVDYRDNRETSRMRQRLERINEAIGGTTIGVPGTEQLGHVSCSGENVIDFRQKYMRRIFNGDMKRGGRFYDRGAWQNVPKKDRARITVCGEATVELDYAQLHPKLVYSRAALPLEGDSYTLPGWSRPVGKSAFNILLNARTHQAAIGAIAESEPMLDAFPPMDRPGRRKLAAALIRDLKSLHAPVAGLFHTGVGLELQRIDGDMAERVQISLLGKGIVCLPIHDSFIVAARHVDHLREAMVEAAGMAGIIGGEDNLVRSVA